MYSNIFKKVYVEQKALKHSIATDILKKLQREKDFCIIKDYDDYFSRIEKPYWNRTGNLNLFLAVKKGQIIKSAPPAYGRPSANARHYYFVHAYNCIYACHYCYLQGYFRSPDIVLFVNRNEILSAISDTIIADASRNEKSFFYSGEFSDSLALSDISAEVPDYLQFFSNHPHAQLELRTKSTKITQLLAYAKRCGAPSNTIVAYSLSGEAASKQFDEKTPSLNARILAIKKIVNAGYRIAFHLDPIIVFESETAVLKQYRTLLAKLAEIVASNPQKFTYMSLGMLRFTPLAMRAVKKNHFFSPLWNTELSSSGDDTNARKRYGKSYRNQLLATIKTSAVSLGFPQEKIYSCME